MEILVYRQDVEKDYETVAVIDWKNFDKKVKERPDDYVFILSPDEMNKFIETVIIAPMTTKTKSYPTRVPITFKRKEGWIVLDQLRTVDKRRLIQNLGKVDQKTVLKIKSVIKEMLVD